jgi:hypothetical protein
MIFLTATSIALVGVKLTYLGYLTISMVAILGKTIGARLGGATTRHINTNSPFSIKTHNAEY